MQKNRFFGKNDGVPKPPEGIFCHYQNHLEGKIRKGPATTFLNSMYCNIETPWATAVSVILANFFVTTKDKIAYFKNSLDLWFMYLISAKRKQNQSLIYQCFVSLLHPNKHNFPKKSNFQKGHLRCSFLACYTCWIIS